MAPHVVHVRLRHAQVTLAVSEVVGPDPGQCPPAGVVEVAVGEVATPHRPGLVEGAGDDPLVAMIVRDAHVVDERRQGVGRAPPLDPAPEPGATVVEIHQPVHGAAAPRPAWFRERLEASSAELGAVGGSTAAVPPMAHPEPTPLRPAPPPAARWIVTQAFRVFGGIGAATTNGSGPRGSRRRHDFSRRTAVTGPAQERRATRRSGA